MLCPLSGLWEVVCLLFCIQYCHLIFSHGCSLSCEYIKRNVEKVWGARYTLGARYLSKNTVLYGDLSPKSALGRNVCAYLLCTVLFASQDEWLCCEGNKLLLQVWKACLNSIRREKLVVNTVTVTCHLESQHLSVYTVVDFFVLPVLWLNANVKMKSMIFCNSVAHGATSYHMNAVMFQTFFH